jgi:tetratricopeptide (TPR) repeat protein
MREAAEIAARTPTQHCGPAHPIRQSDVGGVEGLGRALPFEFTEFLTPSPKVADVGQSEGSVAELLAPVIDETTPQLHRKVSGPAPVVHEDLDRAARDAALRGDVERATKLYRMLLNRRSDDLNARYKLALLLDQSGDHDEALELLDRCISHDPANVAMRVNRGSVLATVARYAEAESDLREAVALDPSHADGHFNLGLVEVRRGRWADAIPHLRRALELDSSNATAYFYLGEALNHVDDIYGALQAYERATELHPVNPAAFYGLGIVLDRLGRPEEATQMYRRSREMAAR